MLLGFNLFFLYDNSKVQKTGGEHNLENQFIANKINKYKINYDEIVKLTDNQIQIKLQKIQEKYKNKVFLLNGLQKIKKELYYMNKEKHILVVYNY